ncbi:MAG: hypothetical protein R2822_28940 [Spirosomataceae bacterium]
MPAKGIQAIPEQIAAKLGSENIRLNTKVKGLQGNTVLLENGETIQAKPSWWLPMLLTPIGLLQRKVKRDFNTTTCTYLQQQDGRLYPKR